MAKGSLSQEQRARLSWVKAPGRKVSLTRFPDFFFVGPQRTGSTWLHRNLREHPNIFLSEPKETFFFSALKNPGNSKFQSDRLDWYLALFRDPPWRAAIRRARCLWNFARPHRPRVFGEATASYAALDADVIDEIVVLNPELRVLLMVRDPIERAWSHAKKALVRDPGRKLDQVSDHDFETFFARKHQRRCASYSENISRWQARLRPGHLLVGSFEDVSSRPEEFLLEIMGFLGVDADPRYVPAAARRRVNATEDADLPERYRRYLEELLGEDIRRLRELR